MAKILDPDDLNQGTEVEFITGSKLVKLNVAGNVTASDGISMQALYSFIKEEWRTDSNLIKFPFPMEAITSEQFELINGWDISGSWIAALNEPSSSKALLRDAGWALKNSNGDSLEEFMNITSLGTFDSSSDQAYYLQSGSAGYIPTSSIYQAEVNEPVRIYASGAQYGAPDIINFRDYFVIYLREEGKTYGIYDLNTEQNITNLTYRKFALPLSNILDTKISASDAYLATNPAPYDGMSITYYTESVIRSIGGVDYPFKVIIDGNNADAEDIYEWVQYQLRQTTNIDSGDNLATVRGDTAEDLLAFSGDTLRTLQVTILGGIPTTDGGVYIDNFKAADTNRLEFTDDSGSVQTFPFVAAGTISFNSNLSTDPSASFFVFFTNDDAGLDSGRDFGTDTAIIIKDNTGPTDISGLVNGSSSIDFDYDYDGNIQRGDTSSGSDAPFTAVALGLGTAQYVVTTGTIGRSTTNTINYVAALERNYLNE